MKSCPACGSKSIWRNEVESRFAGEIGFGAIYGPWRCNGCKWIEYEYSPETLEEYSNKGPLLTKRPPIDRVRQT
jgi:hypothetical protein